MARRANEVVRLLEELRRLNVPEDAPLLANGRAMESAPASAEMDVDGADQDARPPKRPWEDMEGEEVDELEEPDQAPYPTPTDTKGSPPQRTTAEADMELIRTKRAATTVTGPPGGPPKSKYRKRSRATPPGKCHSCNIRETPEWRRGPDGARTLCNACGLRPCFLWCCAIGGADGATLDYAKLMRKREKEHGGAPIDMDTLRASARADMASKAAKGTPRSKNAPPALVLPAPAPGQGPGSDAPPPPPQPAHHEGSFQLTLGPALSPSEVQAQMHSAPPPPVSSGWATSGTQRAYAPEQLQHQSFMRTGQTSPR
ncbi:hypothetical protein B0H11DRAFT_1926181 [Mycena galericulata]|nr:hypothetical protein B0H11DRAFT_1926181 [Mycena galericulata]